MGLSEVLLCIVCRSSTQESGRMPEPQLQSIEFKQAGKTWNDSLTLRAEKYQMSRLILQQDNERKQ